MNSLLASKACDVTGVVGIACARHGCYAPNALVDLFKGEQQKNVDYAFLQAIKTTNFEEDQGILLIYDIACQYFVHFRERIRGHLSTNVAVEAAIGLFHVHAHKDECFFRFAPSFIPQSGKQIGEILESLWSAMNAISPTVRTATLAHRAEMLDDHASDSNHKKSLGMTTTLIKLYQNAKEMVVHAETYYARLTDAADANWLVLWTEAIERAEAMRSQDVAVMDIYKAEISEQASTAITATNATQSPQQEWMEMALMVEEMQLEIQAKARQARRSPMASLKEALEKSRERLAALMTQLRLLQHAAGISESARPSAIEHPSEATWIIPDVIEAAEAGEAPRAPQGIAPSIVGELPPIENQIIALPSNGNVSREHQGTELPFRIQQARRHLSRIRELIADKSFQYSHVIRVVRRTGVTTRSRATIKKLNAQIALHCHIYARARARLLILGADPSITRNLKILTPEDIKASTAIVNPNVEGSTTLELSWIWQGSQGHRFGLTREIDEAEADPSTMLECKCAYLRRLILSSSAS